MTAPHTILDEFEVGEERWRIGCFAGTPETVTVYLEYDYGMPPKPDPRWWPQGWGIVNGDGSKRNMLAQHGTAQVFVDAHPGWWQRLLAGSFEHQMDAAVAHLKVLVCRRHEAEADRDRRLTEFVKRSGGVRLQSPPCVPEPPRMPFPDPPGGEARCASPS